jgi:hypothetical protein
MGWVAEERGLGGSRVRDGLSWDLPIDEVWEAWVGALVADLAPRCGFSALGRGDTTRRLNWSTSTSSMRMLIPDSVLLGPDQLVWVDAKYKAHPQHLAHRGWSGLEEGTPDAHRADLHQALGSGASKRSFRPAGHDEDTVWDRQRIFGKVPGQHCGMALVEGLDSIR